MVYFANSIKLTTIKCEENVSQVVLALMIIFQIFLMKKNFLWYVIIYKVFLQDWVMEIVAYDHDRYANHTELCTLHVSFKDAKNIFVNPEVHMFNYRMKLSDRVKFFISMLLIIKPS